MKVASRRKSTGAIKSFMNTEGLQHECVRELMVLILPVLLYGKERMVWRENERPVHMDNFKVVLEVCWIL